MIQSKKIYSFHIGEMGVTNEKGAILKAPNLGSCLGVALYDPMVKVGGMVHCFLPLSTMDLERAKTNPGIFVDTAIIDLFKKLISLGAEKSRIKIGVAGGSSMTGISEQENSVGKRNYTVLKKVLWKNQLLISGEDIGGSISRTISLEIDTGVIMLRTNDGIKRLA